MKKALRSLLVFGNVSISLTDSILVGENYMCYVSVSLIYTYGTQGGGQVVIRINWSDISSPLAAFLCKKVGTTLHSDSAGFLGNGKEGTYCCCLARIILGPVFHAVILNPTCTSESSRSLKNSWCPKPQIN